MKIYTLLPVIVVRMPTEGNGLKSLHNEDIRIKGLCKQADRVTEASLARSRGSRVVGHGHRDGRIRTVRLALYTSCIIYNTPLSPLPNLRWPEPTTVSRVRITIIDTIFQGWHLGPRDTIGSGAFARYIHIQTGARGSGRVHGSVGRQRRGARGQRDRRLQ